MHSQGEQPINTKENKCSPELNCTSVFQLPKLQFLSNI